MQFPAHTLTIPNPAEKIKGDEVMYPNTNTRGIFGTLSMQAALNLYLPPEDTPCVMHAFHAGSDDRRRRTVFPKRCHVYHLR